ncbi:MAG: SurA N-terminal domain-containing protein [Thermodesulfobacteriota bacterium]
MLNLMRKHARNWLMKVILGIIIIVFVFYFGTMGDRQRAERIAMIDGKPIVYADFQREYQNLLDVYRQRFGQGLNDEMIKSLNLKQQALDNLVNQAVVLLKAEAMHIKVTDEEVRSMILAYPGFQRDGAFDQRIYEQTLRSNRMATDEFEQIQRMLLISMKVEDLIRSGVGVSDQEVQDIFRMQNEKIRVEFIQISPKSFTGAVKTAPADLEALLKSQESQFRVPERVQIKYLAFMGQDYAAAFKIPDADVADYYERNKEQWTKDKKVQPLAAVRDRIVAELSLVKGMYAASDEAKKAHDTIYQNENFDAYAAQNKLTVRTTGLFGLHAPPPEFRGVADFGKMIAGLQKNDISRVIQGEKGYYIVMLVDRKPPYLPALKEIEPEVEKLFRETEAKRLAGKQAESTLARLKKGESLEAVAREMGLKVNQTGLIQPGTPVAGLGSSPELVEALFQISEKKPYPEQALLVDGNYAIIRFKDKSQSGDKDFASQKEAITKYLEQQKRSEAVKAWIEGSKAALIKEGRLEYTRDFKDL